MKLTNLDDVSCPAARALECVGEWWSILIIRNAFQGMTRFDEFAQSLGIAPNMLTRRLKHLVDTGVFERRLYSTRPPRYEYVLTDQGQDFFPVLVTLFHWGNKHRMPEGPLLQMRDRDSGALLDPLLVDRSSLKPITLHNTRLSAGPAATAETIERLEQLKKMRIKKSLASELSPENQS